MCLHCNITSRVLYVLIPSCLSVFPCLVAVVPAVPSCTEGLILPTFLPPTPDHRTQINATVNQMLEIPIRAEATRSMWVKVKLKEVNKGWIAELPLVESGIWSDLLCLMRPTHFIFYETGLVRPGCKEHTLINLYSQSSRHLVATLCLESSPGLLAVEHAHKTQGGIQGASFPDV